MPESMPNRPPRCKIGMVDDSKKLLDMFGIPYVDAPSEGELLHT